jgi:hypothetical protein
MLSGVHETFLPYAGDFLVFPKPSCRTQETFWCSRNLPAVRRELATVGETFSQGAGRFLAATQRRGEKKRKCSPASRP